MIRPNLLFAAILLSSAALAGCDRDQAPSPSFPPQPPPIPGAPLVYYRFPFAGKWRVQRTHYGAKQSDQTFALDLVPLERAEEKSTNAGYPCYGRPVLADAPGVIAIAVDGIPDNVPGGQKNVYDQHGNYVVIDHRNGEFSLMAHLIPGSVKVRPGMQVQAGMELGRCGNTGMSDFPHIHWQVMDNMNAAGARGLPPRLAPYRRNDKSSVDLPDKKDTLENE